MPKKSRGGDAAPPLKDVLSDVTSVALAILSQATVMLVKNEPWSKEQTQLIGRALGWLTLVTVDTENDFTQTLLDGAKESNVYRTSGKTLPSAMESVRMSSLVAAKGGRRRGGAIPLVASVILGLVTLLYGGNKVVTIMDLKEQRSTLRKEATEQIKKACPIDLALGPPEKPLFNWGGEYSVKLAEYNANVATCTAVKDALASRIVAADTKLKQAWDVVPTEIQTFTTAAALVTQGPLAATPAGLSTAAAIGAAASQVTRAVIEGQLPTDPKEFSKFVNSLSGAFPDAPEPPASTSAEPQFTGTSDTTRKKGGARLANLPINVAARLLSAPTRRGKRSSSSSKKGYTRRQRALRS